MDGGPRQGARRAPQARHRQPRPAPRPSATPATKNASVRVPRLTRHLFPRNTATASPVATVSIRPTAPNVQFPPAPLARTPPPADGIRRRRERQRATALGGLRAHLPSGGLGPEAPPFLRRPAPARANARRRNQEGRGPGGDQAWQARRQSRGQEETGRRRGCCRRWPRRATAARDKRHLEPRLGRRRSIPAISTVPRRCRDPSREMPLTPRGETPPPPSFLSRRARLRPP